MSNGIITDNIHFAITQQDFIDLMNENAELEAQLAETDQAIVDRLLRMKELDKENASLKECIAELKQCCSQRGARMQIMFDYNKTVFHVIPAEWLAWFDADGVPVSKEIEK